MLDKKIKRIFDLMFSCFSLILLSPLFLIVAIAIKLESKGSVFFKQERLGENGRVFEIYKFRSMCVGAEKKGVYEMQNDSRVTRIGRIIRATSIDELPQLFNIIKADMSLIGPRPTLTYHPKRYEEYTNEQKRRFVVKPGITGLAQISGRKAMLWDERLKKDVEYVKNLSIMLDAYIFFKTFLVVISKKNNYNIEQTSKASSTR